MIFFNPKIYFSVLQYLEICQPKILNFLNQIEQSDNQGGRVTFIFYAVTFQPLTSKLRGKKFLQFLTTVTSLSITTATNQMNLKTMNTNSNN